MQTYRYPNINLSKNRFSWTHPLTFLLLNNPPKIICLCVLHALHKNAEHVIFCRGRHSWLATDSTLRSRIRRVICFDVLEVFRRSRNTAVVCAHGSSVASARHSRPIRCLSTVVLLGARTAGSCVGAVVFSVPTQLPIPRMHNALRVRYHLSFRSEVKTFIPSTPSAMNMTTT